MKLIGVGFGRTGTMSIKTALEDEGQGPCFHMIDLIRNPDIVDPWHDAAVKGEKDWDKMFAGYNATIDWPGCTFWKELIEVYPEAPVLLNIRDFDPWYKSLHNTVYALRLASEKGELTPDPNRPPPSPKLWEVIGTLLYKVDFQGNFEDESWMREMYANRIEEIKDTVPSERLTVWKLEDNPGWGPIADALGIETPNAPFPHLHDTDNFREEFGLPPLEKAA